MPGLITLQFLVDVWHMDGFSGGVWGGSNPPQGRVNTPPEYVETPPEKLETPPEISLIFNIFPTTV